MDNKTIICKIQSIVQDILDNESLNINEQTEATDVEGWDSLAHINIVSQIESEFGVRFSLDELARFSSVGKIIEAVLQKTS
jgi:acyl carrier protein